MAYELYQSRHKGYEIDNLLDDVVDLNTDVAALKTEYDANKVKMSDGTILPLYLVNTYATKTELSAKADSTQVAADIATATTDMATNTGVASAIATATTDMATNTGVASAIATATTDMATNTSVASDIATATADMATNTSVASDIATATTDMATNASVAAAIAAAAYTLPEATTSTLGGVKPDGTTITVDSDGTIHGTGGGGGGSGHTIIDSSGASMTTRTGLQFGSDLETSDNGSSNKTVVTPHELTNEEVAEILNVLPVNPSSNYVPNTGFTPVGTIIAVMGNNAPPHYLKCDGVIYNISQYPVLAKYFKDQFGSENYFGGDGTTTFAVPDLRGEFLRGTGINSHTNQGDGGSVGDHQDATELPQYYTGKRGSDNNYYMGFRLPSDVTISEYNIIEKADNSISRSTNAIYGNIPSDTSGTASVNTYKATTRPTNTSVLYCIAVQNIYIDAKCNYSTNEMVVGTWIDGKPLYQKTIVDTFGPNATNNKIISDVAYNVDKVIETKGSVYYENSSAGEVYWQPLTMLNNTIQYVTKAWPYIKQTSRDCGLLLFNTNSAIFNKEVIITIYYTKTTD